MAVLMGPSQTPADGRRTAAPPRHGSRQTRPNRQATAERQTSQRSPMTPSEQTIAQELNKLRIVWTYEPELFLTGLTGKGKQGIRPDFCLPKFKLFIEVTEAQDEGPKRQKIRAAESLHGIRILLIGRTELKRMQDGKVTLLELITARLRELNKPAPSMV